MKRVFLLKGLDCPHCSAEIERDVGQVQGVSSAAVNLLAQTLTVEADEALLPDLLPTVERIVHVHEPDVPVAPVDSDSVPAFLTEGVTETHDDDCCHDGCHGADSETEQRALQERLVRLLVGAAIYVAALAIRFFASVPVGVELAVLVGAYVILGHDVLLRAARNISRGRLFDENFLMTVSTIGAFAIGEYPEAVAVMLFYQIGEYFQDRAVARSRRSIADLMDIRPDSATVRRNGSLCVVDPSEVSVGELLVVKPGERIPLDGIVREGESALDTRALTGESLLKSVREGDSVLSGCINQSCLLSIEVTRTYGQSTVSKIVDLVENAASRKAPTEQFITRFAHYYTPAVVVLAVLLAVVPPLLLGGGWTEWIRRAFVFLVISCPCALVISIPLTFFGGIGAASRRGVLVKGGNYLEALHKLSTVVFDKTGTLTKGNFVLVDSIPADGHDAEELLDYAAIAEQFSTHPIARSVLDAHAVPAAPHELRDYEEFSGKGVAVRVDGRLLLVGNDALMQERQISLVPIDAAGTRLHVALDSEYLGCLVIADEIKEDSRSAISALRRNGIQKMVMLTGDGEGIARSVAQELRLDAWHAQLLPDQKLAKLEELAHAQTKGTLAFVGDGINDAPVLARADIGIAMGGLGSDAAIEAADVVLMTDEPSKIVDALAVAQTTRRIVVQNIVFALGVKVVFLVLGAMGIATMWHAVFGDVGVMILAVLNAMRMLKK